MKCSKLSVFFFCFNSLSLSLNKNILLRMKFIDFFLLCLIMIFYLNTLFLPFSSLFICIFFYLFFKSLFSNFISYFLLFFSLKVSEWEKKWVKKNFKSKWRKFRQILFFLIFLFFFHKFSPILLNKTRIN